MSAGSLYRLGNILGMLLQNSVGNCTINMYNTLRRMLTLLYKPDQPKRLHCGPSTPISLIDAAIQLWLYLAYIHYKWSAATTADTDTMPSSAVWSLPCIVKKEGRNGAKESTNRLDGPAGQRTAENYVAHAWWLERAAVYVKYVPTAVPATYVHARYTY